MKRGLDCKYKIPSHLYNLSKIKVIRIDKITREEYGMRIAEGPHLISFTELK